MGTFLTVAIGLIALAVLIWLVARVIRADQLEGEHVFTGSEPEHRHEEDAKLEAHLAEWDRSREDPEAIRDERG